jgi:hypothetical protein
MESEMAPEVLDTRNPKVKAYWSTDLHEVVDALVSLIKTRIKKGHFYRAVHREQCNLVGLVGLAEQMAPQILADSDDKPFGEMDPVILGMLPNYGVFVEPLHGYGLGEGERDAALAVRCAALQRLKCRAYAVMALATDPWTGGDILVIAAADRKGRKVGELAPVKIEGKVINVGQWQPVEAGGRFCDLLERNADMWVSSVSLHAKGDAKQAEAHDRLWAVSEAVRFDVNAVDSVTLDERLATKHDVLAKFVEDGGAMDIPPDQFAIFCAGIDKVTEYVMNATRETHQQMIREAGLEPDEASDRDGIRRSIIIRKHMIAAKIAERARAGRPPGTGKVPDNWPFC